MKVRHHNIPASYLYLEKNNKILLLKRVNTGYEDGNYSLVAGHVEIGEPFSETIIREAFEESGIKIESKNLKVVHVLHRKSIDSERVDVFFTTDKWEGKIENKEPNKCSELEWFDINNLPKNIVPYVKFVIEKIKQDVFYSEYGWNEKNMKERNI
ncbi:MAG: NUDIX domain-containing protein [Parachlamydiales bacterium]|jgi:ADP-ribose pyrophosphatase YjhB (NUDIX family)